MTQTDMDAHREYWRPMQHTTTTGYIAGRSEIVTVQQADYKYMSFFMHNGRRVVMPVQKRTQCLNAPSDQYPRLDTTNYQYDDYGHITSLTYGDNCGFRYTITNAYNQQGLLTTKEVEPFGEYPRIYRQSYDPTKRFVVWQADPDGNEVTRTFDPATGLCLSETDINGLTTASTATPSWKKTGNRKPAYTTIFWGARCTPMWLDKAIGTWCITGWGKWSNRRWFPTSMSTFPTHPRYGRPCGMI